MDILTQISGLASNAMAQTLLKLSVSEVAPVASKAAAAEAVALLADADKGVDAARAALDTLEASNPRVMVAVDAIQAACSGIVAVPTEDQAVALLHHAIDVARGYLPTLLPGSASAPTP